MCESMCAPMWPHVESAILQLVRQLLAVLYYSRTADMAATNPIHCHSDNC
jgi:hypothetical protein